PPPATSDLYFSTTGNTNPTGVGGTADNADIYTWNGTSFARSIDANTAPYNLPTGIFGIGDANVDGFSRVDATHFYMSFSDAILVPGLGLTPVQDEDVVYYDNGTWSLWFDGSVRGLPATDLDAISVVGNTLYFSTNNTAIPPGAGGTGDDADIYRWNGASTYTRVVDASAAPYSLPSTGSVTGTTNPNVDGLIFVDATHFYLSFGNVATTMPGTLGTVQDEDVVYFNAGTWSVYFDGTAPGLTADNQDLDAISFATGALPPPPPPTPPAVSPLYFSTAGGGALPGVSNPRSSDVYLRNGTGFSKVFDASAAFGVIGSLLVNVDGYDRVDNTHFYASFSGPVSLAGLGTVQDEDVVYYNAGVWSLYFDGSAHGLGGSANLDLDAISVEGAVGGVGGTLYFSTLGNTSPPGVGGTADDADIYSWNGTAYSRVIDASAAPYLLPAAANVDGFVRVDATHFYLSFSGTTTTVPVLGVVQDEDVLYYNAGAWSVYYDGTADGLTADNQDVDAFDIPVTP
ncbi:MAG: hypothetical protein ABI934_01150, partial [Actinomycetota bacterium]